MLFPLKEGENMDNFRGGRYSWGSDMKNSARTAVLAVVLAGAAGCQSSSPARAVEARVVVNTASVLRTVKPGLVFGANLGSWVSETRLGTATRLALAELRPSVARFPGGNISNNYCWVTQKVSGNDHLVWEDWSWGTDVSEFLAFIKGAGCVPMFSLNPFDHTIDGSVHSAVDEAAALADVFVANGFPGAYYEVGNENEGSWNPMLTIDEYADAFVRLITAVKTADPSAVALGPVAASYNMTWIGGFLDALEARGALGLLDGVSFHHYGGWISNSNSNGIDLDDPQALGDEIESVRAALAAHGLPSAKVVVNEFNAAIWDTGATRGQFTIEQGLWLADALGTCLEHADMANLWIHLHPGTDPHSLLDSDADPPRQTRNYWPVYLAAQTLASSDPAAEVPVITLTTNTTTADMTAYAVEKPDGTVGVLLINKTGAALETAVDLSAVPASVSARSLDRTAYEAGTGPVAADARIEGKSVKVTVPALAVLGLEIH
jgi:hypothetical protein